VNRSLRRTLAGRFAVTMGVGLLAVAAAALYGSHLFFEHRVDPAVIRSAMAPVLAGVVLLLSGATFVGAWWLAGSAVRPVYEITEQATRIEAGTLDQRIVAHAETDEYRGLVAVLNRMLERIEVAFKNQRRLTADVSHELRSPLTALRGEIEVALRSERTSRDYQRVLHSALEEIDRLTAMSDDLLLITRADAGVVTAHPAPTDINAMIRREVDGMRGRIEEKQLTVRAELDLGLGSVAVDPALTRRLIEELLDNAVKFAPHGGEVVVTTGTTERGLHLTITNSGSPLSVDELAHLFEPFYRADQARTRGTGTGLGLAFAAAVTKLHGGSIRAVNVPGGGVRLECELRGVNAARQAA
jgi:signal transduction histidine kinase